MIFNDSSDEQPSSPVNRTLMIEEFTKSLLGSVEKFHLRSKHRQTNVNIVNALNYMEIGGVNGSAHVDYDVMRSLTRSETRKYCHLQTVRARGSVTYSSRRLVIPSREEMLSMDTHQSTPILGLDFAEKIVSTLTVDYQPPRSDGSVPNLLLLVLSNYGRLRFCDLKTGTCLHTFQLPIRRFKFKHIHWNKAFSEVWLLGRAVLPGHEDGSERTTGVSPSIALFEIQPARFKALLQLDRNVFHNIHAAGLEDDVLVTFNASPHSCTLYSFDEIYREHCTQIFDPLGENERCENVSFNIKLSEKPKELFEVKGDFAAVYFGGSCRVILCEPQTARYKYVLREVTSNETPILHDLRLLGPKQGVALAIDCSTMMLYADSSNFLRFEGIHLACYGVSSLLEDQRRSEVRVRWRTALLPGRRSDTDGQWVTGPTYHDFVKTKFGRTSRATVAVPVVANLPVRVLKTTYDAATDLIHLLALYDVANVDGCTVSVVGAEPDPDWITLVISIRGLTGEIYKITRVSTIDMDVVRKVELSVEDEVMVLSYYDGKNTTVEMYQLTEHDAVNWTPETSPAGSLHSYTSEALSRKQRRKLRSGRAPQARQELDIT